MSPERVLEQEYQYSSDVWSAGCLLYEVTALRHCGGTEGKHRGEIGWSFNGARHPQVG